MLSRLRPATPLWGGGACSSSVQGARWTEDPAFPAALPRGPPGCFSVGRRGWGDPEDPDTRNDSKENELFLTPGRLPQQEEVTDSGHRLTGAPGMEAPSSEEASPPIWPGTPAPPAAPPPAGATPPPGPGRESPARGAAGLEPGKCPRRPQSETCPAAPK